MPRRNKRAKTVVHQQKAHPTTSSRSGFVDMLIAALLFSIMNACVYAISVLDNSAPASIISFIRIICNLLILLIPALLTRQTAGLFGDRRPSLWLRGLFGGLALMLSFAAITRIGSGESAFLAATNGLFIGLAGDTGRLLVLTGIAGSSAQYYMTRAYQMAPAALVSAVGYLQPVLSMGWGVMLFRVLLSLYANPAHPRQRFAPVKLYPD